MLQINPHWIVQYTPESLYTLAGIVNGNSSELLRIYGERYNKLKKLEVNWMKCLIRF